jgi:1-deoxy-D-xylulose-5-phosphate reductoisomerase
MTLRHLDFCPPDMSKFPCLRLAYEAAAAGGAKTVALNAADEIAVSAFLDGSIGFDQIPGVIEEVLGWADSGKLDSIAKVLDADAESRRYAHEQVAKIKLNTARTSVRAGATSFA